MKNQQDATLAVLLISHCKITLHVSDASASIIRSTNILFDDKTVGKNRVLFLAADVYGVLFYVKCGLRSYRGCVIACSF